MKISPHNFTLELNGKTIYLETGLLAEQADAAVTVQLGETVVLATVVLGQKPRANVNYLPLLVDYEERYYATGRIFGSRFVRRESRPSEEAILSARLIDRTIRPLFDHKIRNDIQVVLTVLSIDGQNDPDVLGILAASTALMISDIPWGGPVGAIRVGLNSEGAFAVNPTYEERAAGLAEIVVSGPQGLVNMLESQAKEIPEAKVLEIIKHSEGFRSQLIDFQRQIASQIGKPKSEVTIEEIPEDFRTKTHEFLQGKVEPAIFTADKVERTQNLEKLRAELNLWVQEKFPEIAQNLAWAEEILQEEISEITHKSILGKGQRPDGRKPDEIRSLQAMVAVLPRTHGSGLFIRGNTQVLTSLTLGSPGDVLMIQGMEIQAEKRFIHHYNFPPYSVGEIGPMRGPGRRDIGHGALAERAILPLIPAKESFPYTIRLVSEVLSSNGSSSMASVCGSTLALMDGGVPLKAPAAGIAMGLMTEQNQKSETKNQKYVVLTDIQGPEDHHGDMDCKIAGTKQGVTAVQMDVKLDGVSANILAETFEQARKARLEILEAITQAIAEPRAELSSLAPRIFTIQINPEKIGAIIGPGGKVINEITKTTGVTIDIEDSGLVYVTSPNQESADRAMQWIKDLTRELKPGEEFEGKVTRVVDFGGFIELVPGQEGLLHVSELIPGYRVERAADVLKPGQTIRVRVQNIDDQGRVKLELANPQEFESLRGSATGQSSMPQRPMGRYRAMGERRSGPRRPRI